MQQPSATADEIIIGWVMEDLGSIFVLQRELVFGDRQGAWPLEVQGNLCLRLEDSRRRLLVG